MHDPDWHDGHSDNTDISFSDLVLGVELAGALTGHHVSIADAATAAIAIELALEHGGTGLHSHPTGSQHEIPAFSHPEWSAPEGGATSGDARRFEMPGIARTETTVEILAWPHGGTESNPHEQVRKMAGGLGLIPFRVWDVNMAGFTEVDRTEKGILPIAKRRNQRQSDIQPNGWYPNASGETHQWREFFRRPPKKFFLGRADDFESRRTFLIAFGSTWRYAETQDYETRVGFSVYSLAFSQNAAWTYRFDQIREFRRYAEKLAQQVNDYLQKYPPTAESVMERRKRMGP